MRFDALLRCHVVMNYVSLKATDKPFKKTMAGASRGFRDSLIREKVAAGDTRAGALRFIDRRMNEKDFVVLDDASETGLAKAVKVCLELDR